MGLKYLLDSNVIIGFLANKLPAAGMKFVSDIVDDAPYASVISKIEVLRFRDTPENEAVLADFVRRFVICPLNNVAVEYTIELCRQSRIKLPDAIIAATALTENCALVTRNTADFKHIAKLEVINPWEIQAT